MHRWEQIARQRLFLSPSLYPLQVRWTNPFDIDNDTICISSEPRYQILSLSHSNSFPTLELPSIKHHQGNSFHLHSTENSPTNSPIHNLKYCTSTTCNFNFPLLQPLLALMCTLRWPGENPPRHICDSAAARNSTTPHLTSQPISHVARRHDFLSATVYSSIYPGRGPQLLKCLRHSPIYSAKTVLRILSTLFFLRVCVPGLPPSFCNPHYSGGKPFQRSLPRLLKL